MHPFPSDTVISVPKKFTDPFRYSPHPMVRKASELLISRIERSKELSQAFKEGKMLGVLVVSDRYGNIGYLAGFSGNIGGRSKIEGFVPPICDLMDPYGHFKVKEAEITAINKAIASASENPELKRLQEELREAERDRDSEIGEMKARIAIAKRERDEIRNEVSDPSRLSELIRESQFEKAQLKRLRTSWEERIEGIRNGISIWEDEIRAMKARRASMSDSLQDWIFSQYIVHNALGQEFSIKEIFANDGLVPPGGTGECAAPKLLEHAYRNSLKPLAMGEFWYGSPSATAVRTQGHFYPSCTSKCGPLLGFMMKGLDIAPDPYTIFGKPQVIHEDEAVIVVSKPAGMPSVPGLDGKPSLLEWLQSAYSESVTSVHRLDMDTSGIMVYAKDPVSATALQRQFEIHSISKTYKARLSQEGEGSDIKDGDKGEINIPLNADYDERPRQKVDRQQGKSAITAYEVTSALPSGEIDIIFHPHTGRTHQLRVHSAHSLGLGHPIVGDLLYGGSTASRMHLHAYEISFDHPLSGKRLTFSTDINGFE